MSSTLPIAVDAMSGDRGPATCVPAALAVLREDPALELVLVGQPAVVEPLLAGLDAAARARVRVLPASQVVAMDERPRDAIRRKKDSSLRRALDLVAGGEASACVSAGNTGALMATAHFVLGVIPGVERPAIISSIPSAGGHTHMLDLGANASATPDQLFQFAVMGAVVAAGVHGLERPRVGLLNIGAEDIKGDEIVQAAHRRLQDSKLEYLGYVEGNDIFGDRVDVVVTDGFTGNVALKTMEGLAKMIGGILREEFTAGPVRKLGALAARPALDAIRGRLDPRRYNGASMVGLAGIVIKSHGGADETAFANAVRLGHAEARKGLPTEIGRQLAEAA
ncbi:MAG: phosphate acyltransferase PlsX [Steroidobacteraceae bacterium]|nr:phosphate acyltransferase PlsX [Steroidobacteraceae bacterium]